MLTFVIRKKIGGVTEYMWHTNEKVQLSFDDVSNVVEVMADGHELEWLKESFVNLPYPKNQFCVRWFGDMAKMVVDSLPKNYK